MGKGKRKENEEMKENEGKKKGEEENRAWRRKKKKEKKSSDSHCSNGWKSLVRELKLVYSMRATSRCQKQKR